MHLRSLKHPRWLNPSFGTFVEPEGGTGAGGEGKGGGEQKTDVVAKAEHEKALAELKALKDADAKRQADLKKKSDEDAVKNGEAAKLLKDREAELEAERKRVASYQEREKSRVEKLFGALPKERQEALAKVRAKMDLETFAELLEAEPVAGATDGEGAGGEGENDKAVPPFAGAGRETERRDKSKFKPHPKALAMMENELMRDASIYDRLHMRAERDEETGQRVTVFSVPIRQMFTEMRRGAAPKLTIENAEARRLAAGRK